MLHCWGGPERGLKQSFQPTGEFRASGGPPGPPMANGLHDRAILLECFFSFRDANTKDHRTDLFFSSQQSRRLPGKCCSLRGTGPGCVRSPPPKTAAKIKMSNFQAHLLSCFGDTSVKRVCPSSMFFQTASFGKDLAFLRFVVHFLEPIVGRSVFQNGLQAMKGSNPLLAAFAGVRFRSRVFLIKGTATLTPLAKSRVFEKWTWVKQGGSRKACPVHCSQYILLVAATIILFVCCLAGFWQPIQSMPSH